MAVAKHQLTQSISHNSTSEQKAFSRYLEALIPFLNEINIPTAALKIYLALLSLAWGRNTFKASYETIYGVLHKYDQSFKVRSFEARQKLVYRHLIKTLDYQSEIGLDLIKRSSTSSTKSENGEIVYESYSYDLTVLLNYLHEIIVRSERSADYRTNPGRVIKETATQVGREVRATLNPVSNRKEKPLKAITLDSIKSSVESLKSKLYGFNLSPESLPLLDEVLAPLIERYTELKSYIDGKEYSFELIENVRHISNTFNIEDRIPDKNVRSVTPITDDDDFCLEDELELIADLAAPIPPAAHAATAPGRDDYRTKMSDGSEISSPISAPGRPAAPPPLSINESEHDMTVTIYSHQSILTDGIEQKISFPSGLHELLRDAKLIPVRKHTTGDKAALMAAKQSNAGIVFGSFEPLTEAEIIDKQSQRRDQKVTEMTALVFDIDHGDMNIDLPAFHDLGYKFAFYTSYSHCSANHRFRIIMPLVVPIPANLYLSLWQHYFEKLKRPGSVEGKWNIDTSAKNASRLFYLPAIQSSAHEYQFGVFDQFYEMLDWRQLDLVQLSNAVRSTANNVLPDLSDVDLSQVKRWPNYQQELDNANGDRSVADISYALWCKRFYIPDQAIIKKIIEISGHARENANPLKYAADTVAKAYGPQLSQHQGKSDGPARCTLKVNKQTSS